jgi:hypothetical protein
LPSVSAAHRSAQHDARAQLAVRAFLPAVTAITAVPRDSADDPVAVAVLVEAVSDDSSVLPADDEGGAAAAPVTWPARGRGCGGFGPGEDRHPRPAMDLAHDARLSAGRLSLVIGTLVFAGKVAAWIATGSVAVFSDAMEPGAELRLELRNGVGHAPF